MLDLDNSLTALAALPADPRLASLDTRVFAGIAALSEQRTARRATFTTAAVALCIGFLGASYGAFDRQQAVTPISLGVPSQLAPSSILGG